MKSLKHYEFGIQLQDKDFCNRIDLGFEFSPFVGNSALNDTLDLLSEHDVSIGGSYVLRSFGILEREPQDLDVIGYKMLHDSRLFTDPIVNARLSVSNLAKKILTDQHSFDHQRILETKHFFHNGMKIDFFVKDRSYVYEKSFRHGQNHFFTLSDCIKANYRLYYIMDQFYWLRKIYPAVERKYQKGFSDCEKFIEKTKHLA